MKKRGSFLEYEKPPKPTKTEKIILDYLTKDFYTIKQISTLRKTSIRNTQKIVKKLREKGYLSKDYKKVRFVGGGSEPTRRYDVHGLQYHIRLIHNSVKYKEQFKKSNIIYLETSIVTLYRDALEIHDYNRYTAEDENEATRRALQQLTRNLTTLEHDLDVILLKPRENNIKVVKAKYTEGGNEIAQEQRNYPKPIKVEATEDGKLWFMCDHSFNLDEGHTLHPDTAKPDMSDVVKPYLNDWRDNKPPKLSELAQAIKDLAQENKETASGLNAVVQLLKREYTPPAQNGKEKEVRGYG